MPAPAELPKMIKYRHCRTPLLVPPGFEPALVTRSGQRPSYKLERVRIQGYNGLGKHNRSPTCSLPDGRILFCTAGVAILEEPKTGEQSFYDGHDDDIVCVALHPNGELVATGQARRRAGVGVAARLVGEHTSDAGQGRPCARREGQRRRHDSPLLPRLAVRGGVWAERTAPSELERTRCTWWACGTGKRVSCCKGQWHGARPLAVHQIAAAPYPLAEDAQGGRRCSTLVGVSNAPKFGTLKPADAPGPTRWSSTLRSAS